MDRPSQAAREAALGLSPFASTEDLDLYGSAADRKAFDAVFQAFAKFEAFIRADASDRIIALEADKAELIEGLDDAAISLGYISPRHRRYAQVRIRTLIAKHGGRG